MAKAKWPTDPNCPPENNAQSKKWFRQLESDTKTQLIDCLNEAKVDRAADQVAQKIQKRAEQINRSSFRKLTELRQAGSSLPPVACQMGCNYCCHLEVSCYAPETIRIAEYLRKTRTPKQLAGLIAKMRRHSRFRSGLTKKQKEAGNVAPCPFLGEKGLCSIYEVRPLVCRTYHTFDVNECRQVWLNPMKQLDVTMVTEPCDTRDALSDALEEACRKLKIPVEQIELISGVLVALDNPDAATEWRQGEDIFAGLGT